MEELRSDYIELLKKTLIDFHRRGVTEYRAASTGRKVNLMVRPLMGLFRKMDKKELLICEKVNFNPEDRVNGKDWPLYAESMIGYKRMSNVQELVTNIIRDNIPGDLIETGVWRGGTVIFMRGILKAYGVTDKLVWAADSFEGLPKPDAEKYEADKDDKFYLANELKVSLERVKDNFRKYNLLDDQVKFLKGWFKDTLPGAPIDRLALLRLDGDMYESTMDALVNLYPKLSPGGYIIIDDWGSVQGCRLAVTDYRVKNNISEEIITVDEDAVYWQKN